MVLVDTHNHIYLSEFTNDVDQVIERSAKAGVKKIFLPNIDSTSVQPMLTLEARYPGTCFSMMGVHPTSIKENYQDELSLAETWLQKHSFAGIGETGIDLYWDTSFKKEQTKAFEQHIMWARTYRLPLIVHSRNSIPLLLEILRPYVSKDLRGVFHCFTGNYEQAKQAMDMGFMLGIGGIVTYKNAGMDVLIRKTGISNVVLETDAPYLPPVPYRGKRNEPSYLPLIAARVAELVNLSVEEVAEITTQNARKLFNFE